MDNYPKEFAPAFNEGGGVETPFEEWWPRVQGAFPHVPEEVARTWLHEHWNYSPYQYLPSADYRFRKVNWDAGDLWNIRTTWADYAPGNRAAYEHGKFLATSPTFLEYRTAMYMKTHGRFPAPCPRCRRRAAGSSCGSP